MLICNSNSKKKPRKTFLSKPLTDRAGVQQSLLSSHTSQLCLQPPTCSGHTQQNHCEPGKGKMTLPSAAPNPEFCRFTPSDCSLLQAATLQEHPGRTQPGSPPHQALEESSSTSFPTAAPTVSCNKVPSCYFHIAPITLITQNTFGLCMCHCNPPSESGFAFSSFKNRWRKALLHPKLAY